MMLTNVEYNQLMKLAQAETNIKGHTISMASIIRRRVFKKRLDTS